MVKLSEIKRYSDQGYFKAGSMGPKVASAIKFVENGGEKAIIASLENALASLEEGRGTVIIPD